MNSSLPFSLLLAHAALLFVVVVTDFTRRKVYQAWTLTALLLGVASLWFAPYPWLNAVVGAAIFGLSCWRWYQEQQRPDISVPLGGGDVWVATYLGLLFGFALLPPLLFAIVLLLAGLVWGWLHWRGSVPAAGLWALGALVWLLVAGILGLDPFGPWWFQI